MSTKQAQINTFTDGLNTDLHPLTTPNTVLTDCINGTVITYNGNEFILQNDMGNYKLKKAQLPPDYIPVGIKEYGSIIYIVSYNPIDKKCQIGSYPSPQTLFDNTPRPSKNTFYHGIQINTLDPNWVWDANSETINDTDNVLFTKYSPKQNITILFPEKGDIKDTFLNPGDKYWLYIEPDKEGEELPASTKNTWAFQKINYYTLTDTKEVYEIEDVEEKDSPYIIDGKMSSVTWETPGWLGYKPSLLNLESFNIYLTDITLPAFLENKEGKENEIGGETLSFKMQGQATVNTTEDWSKNFEHLKVLFEIKTDNTPYTILDRKVLYNDKDNYGNKIDVITYNVGKDSYPITDKDKIVTIRATPYLISDITDENTLGIVYDNFRVEYQINLQDLHNTDKIIVFDTYKYSVDKEGIVVNFSLMSPTVNTKNLVVKYNIKSIKNVNKKIEADSKVVNDTEILDATLLGQNIINIKFGTTEAPKFLKENIYILEIVIYVRKNLEGSIEDTPIYSAKQFLITSQVMNDFYSYKNRFQDIYKNEWIEKASKYQTQSKPTLKVSISDSGNKYFSVKKESDIEDINGGTIDEILASVNINDTVVLYVGSKYNEKITPVYDFIKPTVLESDSDSLWGDIDYSIEVDGKLNYTINDKPKVKNIKFTSSSALSFSGEPLNHFSSIYSVYNPKMVDGKEGKPEYLYKQSYINGSEQQLKDGSMIIYTLPKYTPTTKDYYNNVAIEFGERQGWVNIGDITKRTGIYKNNLSDNTASFYTDDHERPNEDSRFKWQAGSSNKTWDEVASVDKFYTNIFRQNKLSLFMPFVFNTVKVDNNGSAWVRLPDGIDYFYNNNDKDRGYAYGMGIMCKAEGTYSMTLLKLFNDGKYAGRFNASDKRSAYLTCSSFGENYTYNDIITQVLFRILLHLYYIPTLGELTSKPFLSEMSSYQYYTFGEVAKLTVSTETTINKIVYKELILSDSTNISTDLGDSSNNFSNNRITPIFNTITKSYTDPISLQDINADEVNYNNLRTQLNETIEILLKEFSENQYRNSTSIYSDYTGPNSNVSTALNVFSKKLIYDHNTYNVYYTDLGSYGFRAAWTDNKNKQVWLYRTVDISNELNFGQLSNIEEFIELSKPTRLFKKYENSTYSEKI